MESVEFSLSSSCKTDVNCFTFTLRLSSKTFHEDFELYLIHFIPFFFLFFFLTDGLEKESGLAGRLHCRPRKVGSRPRENEGQAAHQLSTETGTTGPHSTHKDPKEERAEAWEQGVCHFSLVWYRVNRFS